MTIILPLLLSLLVSVPALGPDQIWSQDESFYLKRYPGARGKTVLYGRDGSKLKSFYWYSPQTYLYNCSGEIRIIRIVQTESYDSAVLYLYSDRKLVNRLSWTDLGISSEQFHELRNTKIINPFIVCDRDQFCILIRNRFWTKVSTTYGSVFDRRDLFQEAIRLPQIAARIEKAGEKEQLTFAFGPVVAHPRAPKTKVVMFGGWTAQYSQGKVTKLRSNPEPISIEAPPSLSGSTLMACGAYDPDAKAIQPKIAIPVAVDCSPTDRQPIPLDTDR